MCVKVHLCGLYECRYIFLQAQVFSCAASPALVCDNIKAAACGSVTSVCTCHIEKNNNKLYWKAS